MMTIFSNYLEQLVEIFMDDFSIFGNSFDACLSNLERVLKRCKDTNLVLNGEKYHFMVNEGIVLGHKVLKNGLEVDQAKIEAMEKLHPPTDVKALRSFLKHAGFYQQFVKDFLKIACPLSMLLKNE